MSIDVGRSGTVPTMANKPPGDSMTPTQPIPPKSTTVKTDKPRPHVCATCTRSFARLEHLKRHERSHTKEKPFQCPVCERCFARRDLLLRHKQKLHADFPDETKPRGQRKKRNSKSSATSTASSSTAGGAGVGAATATMPPNGGGPTGSTESPPAYSELLRNKVQKTSNNSTASGTRSRTMSFSAASATSYSTNKEIETFNQNDQFHPSGPPQVGFSTPQLLPATFSDSSDSNPFDDFFTASDPLFINPQLLGNNDRSHSVSSVPPSNHHHQQQHHQHHPNFLHDQRHNSHPAQLLNFDHDLSWLSPNHSGGVPPNPQTILDSTPSTEFSVESPLALQQQQPPPPAMHQHQQHQHPVTPHDFFNNEHHNTNHNNTFDVNIPDENFWKLDNNTNNTTTNNGSNASHIITPQLRLHILTSLSTPTPFSSTPPPHLPSTLELQRYINAYIENFSKHMPFLHHTLEFTPDNVPLALDMAAVGALYAFEQSNASSIFEISRSCIHVYLESKHDHKAATSDANDIDNFLPKPSAAPSTPLWLVQALLLGVIYGLFSNDPMANEIAVAQANAVISLAKSAGLHLSPLNYVHVPDTNTCSVEEKWKFFIAVQERVRTMHVVHTISCLLSTSYNVPPTLRNEEVQCGSPCDESLWTASSAASWWQIMQKKELDGSLKEVAQGPPFGDYLNQLINGQTLVTKVPQFTLLSLMYGLHLVIQERKTRHDATSDIDANSKKRRFSEHDNDDDSIMHLHEEGKPEFEKEKLWLQTEKGSIEAMLRAWETTWSLSPLASLNPSSQYGPLMSDSIPLSSLAHIRTYIDLRKAKQAFWKRDFDGMGIALDNIHIPITMDGDKKFNGLLESTSFAADTISLWEKHSVKWTLETSVSQTFIHTIVSLFDCGLVMSEFLKRLENKHPSERSEEEESLVKRIIKIFQRVVDVVGNEDLDTSVIADAAIKSEPSHDDLSTVLDLDSKKSDQQQQNGGGSGNDRGLCILVLKSVGKILSKSYVWPFALVMGRALEARSEQLKKNV